MPLADPLTTLISEHYFTVQGVHLSGDANVWMGLSRTQVLADGTGLDEPSPADGYARVPVGAASSITWDINALAYATPAVDIEFPLATGSWGSIVSVFLTTDSAVGGAVDRLIVDRVTPFTIDAGRVFRFPAGGAAVSISLGTFGAGTPVKRYSTARVDTFVLESVLRNVAAPLQNLTYVGIHAYPLISRPQHDGVFGEAWDYTPGAALNYVRALLVKEDFFTAPSNRWESPKVGEIQNVGQFRFHPIGLNAGTGWPAAVNNYIIMDDPGTDPGYTSGPPLPAGSGGGNLLFWFEGPQIFGGSGDNYRVLAGDLDLTLD